MRGKVKVSKRTGLRSYYQIWRAGGTAPSRYSLTYKDAIQTAKRLASKTGKEYYVVLANPKAKVVKQKGGRRR